LLGVRRFAGGCSFDQTWTDRERGNPVGATPQLAST
jgi:hypothetical protein